MTAIIKKETCSEEETTALGERLGGVLSGGAVVLLCGDLGAGKTRFAKGVARALGITQALTSPTYNLVLEYSYVGGEGVLRHFDLYRLEDAEQLDDLDYFGLIEDERAVSLVEWGDRFADALPLDYLLVAIELMEAEEAEFERRVIRLSAHGAHSEEALARFAASLAALEDAGRQHG